MQHLETHALDEAVKHQVNSWWWIKADDCDLVPGLAESTRGVWSGDVDHNDGNLTKLYQKYKDRLLSIENLHLSNPDLYNQLEKQFLLLKSDLEFLHGCKQSEFVSPLL